MYTKDSWKRKQRQSRQDYHNLHPKIIARPGTSSLRYLSYPCMKHLQNLIKTLVWNPSNLPFPSDLSTTTDWKMVLKQTYWYSPILRLYICSMYCLLLFVWPFLCGLRITLPRKRHHLPTITKHPAVEAETMSMKKGVRTPTQIFWVRRSTCSRNAVKCLGQGRNYLWSKNSPANMSFTNFWTILSSTLLVLVRYAPAAWKNWCLLYFCMCSQFRFQ